MSPKDLIKNFYQLDLAKDNNIMDFFHEDCELKWNSSKGYTQLDYQGIKEMLEGVRKSYHSFKFRVSHLLEDENIITTRYTIYATVIERPEKEDALAHFITIWEVKDGKMHTGFEISQLADVSPESLNSYAEIKV
ncbi:nuclear transport factor 2 family protein [Psychroserpens ponticola]|uniref:Nuclear transport factor 2 family protein n=1 Tax=Psychroserpens ponticola TaxID=2932268 RepID=A0ABY7S5G1_9FLAO|nr:nuclear transport factor 2 family protein [Psychroserpens ponticola]WCO03120.1 nuclear transport factor 2 family protein [Psychroserpens ponticola]